MSEEKRRPGAVGVRVIKDQRFSKAAAAKVIPGTSGQHVDPANPDGYSSDLIDPPYPPGDLIKMPETSSILQPLIAAYSTNIPGFGHSFRYKVDMESPDIDESIKKKARQEWLILESFYSSCTFDGNLSTMLKRVIDDREKIGWGALEALSTGNGSLGGFEYVPAHTILMTPMHPDVQVIPRSIIGPDGREVTITYAKRFRRYYQELNNQKIWFKDFLDPRKMDKTSGKFEVEQDGNGNVIKTLFRSQLLF
jgi:capsid portal protein